LWSAAALLPLSGSNYADLMIRVTIRRAKRELAQLLDRARAGEDVIITRGGRPLVRLTVVAQM